MGKLLGVDYGTRRTGVALSDSSGSVATPFGVISQTDPHRVAVELHQLCQKHGVETVVVGLPLNMNGTEGPAAQAARRLADELEALGEKVILWDERLSTRQVEAAVRQAGGKGRGCYDALAAQVILQSYLDAKGGDVLQSHGSGQQS